MTENNGSLGRFLLNAVILLPIVCLAIYWVALQIPSWNQDVPIPGYDSVYGLYLAVAVYVIGAWVEYQRYSGSSEPSELEEVAAE